MSTIALTQAFRPLFPLAAAYTAVGIIVWLAGLSGMISLPAHPTLWHAHEMLFGFAAAIIAGFALTAVVNWTGHPSTTPGSLGLITGLWVAARVLGLFPRTVAQDIAAICDSLFLPGVALLMTRVLLKTENRRNYMFIPFLWGLASINIGFHISLHAGQVDLARGLITFTAWLVGFLMVFMGGRVIPFFSANRCRYQPLQWAWLNWSSTISALLAGILVVLFPQTIWSAVVAAFAGMATLLRLVLWQPWRVWRVPMLWILHIGYGWLTAAYLLAAVVHMGWLQPLTLPIHVLLAGGLGCLGLGMISRVALGHSGRQIEASPTILAAFVLVILAGAVRVASYLPWSWTGLPSLTLSAIFWCLAFALYAGRYIPLLWFQHPSSRSSKNTN
jgi:uncharacterized protein involved in response to NO